MDRRVSTAPSKTWLPKNPPEASRLLRHPSGKSVNHGAAVVVDRPRTCPIPTLTPQFHWNLNNSALNSLSLNQIEELYGLFKFYDSSTSGDALPSINCARLQEILRDAQLLSDGTIISEKSTEKKLQVESVEKIFAQAVMGKLRVYLDADGQPALTFPLFCGALMNCAMLLTPLTRPAIALQRILSILLEDSIADNHDAPAAKGLISHVPIDGSISLWMPGQSDGPHTDDQPDFRELPPFQQVIADCTRDKDLEELKQEELRRHYEVPGRLVASFHPDTLARISSKSRMFDVNDCGTVPRQELFALLSRLGTHIDLPDPYTILAKLNVLSVQRSGNNGDNSDGELTLVQLLQVIEMAREAKRHSATSNLAAIKIRVDRAVTAVKGSIIPIASFQESTKDGDSNNDEVVTSQKVFERKKSGNNGDSTSFRDRGRRHRISVLKSCKSSTTETNVSSHPLLNSKHRSGSKTHLTHPSVSSRKRNVVSRRKSTITSDKLDTTVADFRDFQDDADQESAMQSQRSGTTTRSSAVRDPAILVTGAVSKCSDDPNNDSIVQAPDNNQNLPGNDDQDTQLQGVPSIISMQVHEPLSTSITKTLRIFLLLGGEHDGAIYCTISLAFATRKIEECEGIYYSTAPCETTRMTPVLPTQHNLSNALLMLKKCVLARLEQGFELRPASQLGIVDKTLEDLRDRQSHFSSPVTKTAAVSTSPSPDARRTVRLIRSAASRPQKRHPKPARHHQFELPNDYKDLFATWDVSQHGNYGWIHDINAASPLKPAVPTPTALRCGLLSPLQFNG